MATIYPIATTTDGNGEVVVTSSRKSHAINLISDIKVNLKSIQVEVVHHNRDYGPAFGMVKEMVFSACEIISNIPDPVFNHMPVKRLEDVAEAAKKFMEAVERVRARNQESGTLDVLCADFSAAYDALYDLVAPFSFLAVSGYHDQISKIIRDADAAKNDAIEAKFDTLNAARAAREAAGEQGVATSAKYFGESASDYTAAGYFWLVIVFGIIIGSVVVVAHNLGGLIKDGEHIWDNSALLLSLLMAILALTFASKAYRFNKHNQVVNEHRQNALKVFQAINAAAGDDRELKAIVLTAAANCMFAPQDSGYAKNAPNAEQPIGVMDMLARIIHK